MFRRCDTPAMRRNGWRYLAEMAAGLAICIALTKLSRLYLPGLSDEMLRQAVAISPMLGILFVAVAIVRSIRRLDEYQRGRILGISAAAGGVTVLIAFAYGLLETAGLPHRNMMWIWPVMAVAWAACALGDLWLRKR
jgi:hypothetical protein